MTLPDGWWAVPAAGPRPLPSDGLVLIRNPRALGQLRTDADLIEAIALLGDGDGSTQSPFTFLGEVEIPTTGYCVALSGSDLTVPTVLLLPGGSGIAPAEFSRAYRLIHRWHRALVPHLVSGFCWVGLWRDVAHNQSEINVTLVVEEERWAMALARHQRQQAIFHLDTATLIEVGGDGGPGWRLGVPLPEVLIPSAAELEEYLQ